MAVIDWLSEQDTLIQTKITVNDLYVATPVSYTHLTLPTILRV